MVKQSVCSFCGRKLPVTQLFEGQKGALICYDCIEAGHQIIAKQFDAPAAADAPKGDLTLGELPHPKDIKAYLDQYVIGQDDAKRYLSVAIYNHYKRVLQQDNNEVEIEKSNILLVGPTGTGKTLLARSIAKMLHVPFAIADATSLTQAGYVGEDVESVITKLLQDAHYDVEKAQRGIVFLDEVDKISRKSENPSITRDVSGEGVQQSLLKMLEGSVINVAPEGGRKHPEQQFVKVDTKNILFICGGAFEGIERKIAQRLNTQMVGFEAQQQTRHYDKDNMLKYVAPQDLKSYGLIPEIIGRLPILTHLDPLDRTALRNILTEPKNALTKQYQKLLSMDGTRLVFEDEMLDYIVDQAVAYKLGARGLRALMETVMMDIMYNAGDEKEIVVTKAFAEQQLCKQDMLQLQVNA